jgi:hypothetical protein
MSSECPLCRMSAEIREGFAQTLSENVFDGKCDRCGKIRVSHRAVDLVHKQHRAHLLSAFFRRTEKPPLISPENLDEYLSQIQGPRTVAEKLDALLTLVINGNPVPGTPIGFSCSRDYPLVFAANEVEAQFLLKQLTDRRFLSYNTAPEWIVTADGYARLEQLQATSFKTSPNAFVAMSFDKSRDAIYDNAIEPAVRMAGYHAIRVDRTEHLNRIDDEIIARMRLCRFMVADFTRQRQGVYFEAGFMKGLGRNVYWMCEKTDLAEVHQPHVLMAWGSPFTRPALSGPLPRCFFRGSWRCQKPFSA